MFVLGLLYRTSPLIIPLLVFVLFSKTECLQRNDLFVHVTLKELKTNCSLPCQRVDNDTCIDDCPPKSCCDGYFKTCVGCPKHCLNCMQPDFCLECEDGFVIVAGGCEGSCDAGHYQSPYDKQCNTCPPNCLNCSGLNQCYKCSNNYILYSDTARQLCVLPCTNGSFYNQTNDQCQACAEHCQYCIPSVGCVKCNDGYIISNNFCHFVAITTSMQTTATPTTSMQTTATPTTSMQTTAKPTTSMQTTVTPTATVKSNKHSQIIYIAIGVGGGVVAIVIIFIVILVIVVWYKRRNSPVDFKPLLRFDDDSDEEDSDNIDSI